MDLFSWIVSIVGIALLCLRGLNLPWFTVDWVVVALFFIFSTPFLARFLKKAKFPGTEFEFKETIENSKKILKDSESKKQLIEGNKNILDGAENQHNLLNDFDGEITPELTEEICENDRIDNSCQMFDLTSARSILEHDPTLALAALRIEIEKKLRKELENLKIDEPNYPLYKLLNIYKEKGLLNTAQLEVLQNITQMCNKAIHGVEVQYDIADNILNLAAELNKTFYLGYSSDFSPLDNYEKYGHVCPWEHCIEHMPINDEKASCPIFGHDCPGGKDQAVVCRKNN